MYQVDEKGFFGKFGGAYVPEILYKCVTELQQAYKPIIESEEFKKEYRALLKDYVGRPSPLYYAKRMSEKYGCQLYLKREDLNHTGAHKINNTIGQILLAKKMGKKRIIAETGAGQHGVATAIVCALIYGATVEPRMCNKPLSATQYGDNAHRWHKLTSPQPNNSEHTRNEA